MAQTWLRRFRECGAGSQAGTEQGDSEPARGRGQHRDFPGSLIRAPRVGTSLARGELLPPLPITPERPGQEKAPCRARSQSSLPRPVAAGARPSCCISSTWWLILGRQQPRLAGQGPGRGLELVTAPLTVVAVSALSGLGRAGTHGANCSGTVSSGTSVSSVSSGRTRRRVRVTGDTV